MALHRYPTAQLVFLGDFDACHEYWLYPYQKIDTAGKEAWNFAAYLGLSQLVNQAIRVRAVAGHTINVLDLLVKSDLDRYSV